MDNSYFAERNGSALDVLSPSQSAPSPTITMGSRSNALSSRISSVLSTSYADLDLKDAMHTLDAQNFVNSQDSRRNLRLDLQHDVIQSNGDIIKDFGIVAEQLRRIGDVIKNLNQCCADMRSQLVASGREASSVLQEANGIFAQKAQIESKQHILNAFQAHFVMADEDIAALTASSEPVNDRFFIIMAKVKRIHQDSEVLLGTENEKLGLEIMDQSSKQLNAAFQKLYRWIQKDFKTLDLENPQISSSIRRSLRVLAERPALFQSCMDFFAEAREHNLSDSFHAALTGGAGADAYGKPIEFQAHDPLRYIGDMLAWAHSATVSEREALEVLFVGEGDELAKGIKAGIDADPWSRQENGKSTVYDGRKALNELVGRDLSGVGRLLRQRSEHVITSHEDATLSYKILNLIGFYRATFQKLVGSDSSFLSTLDALETAAERQFKANMRDHVASMQAELSATPVSLNPPDFLRESLETLTSLMQSYETSYSAASGHDHAFEPVLVEALDPFLEASAALSKKMDSPSSEIFMTNCILQVRTTLAPYAFTDHRQTQLSKMLDQHATELTEAQYEFFVDNSGLEPLFEAIFALSDSAADLSKMSSLDVSQPASLIAASQQLDDFLPSALIDAMDNIRFLQSPGLIRDITESAAEKFCADFEMIETRLLAADRLRDQVKQDTEGDDKAERTEPSLREMFPRTSAEIRVLLS